MVGALLFLASPAASYVNGLATKTAGSAHGPWRISDSPALSFALPVEAP